MAYNCKVVDYQKGQHVSIYSRAISENNKKSQNFRKSYHNENRTEQQEKHCINQSVNRTKNKIYNLARSNDWQYFITLTFNQKKVNSENYDDVVKKLTNFMHRIRQVYCPNMVYLIVPELHSDGKHYHFHGLLSNVEGMKFVDSEHRTKNNQIIFNMPQWNYGFTTATKVTDTQKVSGYITKYITKDLGLSLKNKKRYLRSNNCKVTAAEKYNIDFEQFLEVYNESILYAKTVNIPHAHQTIKYFELDT